jgi:hypothetical protein
MTLSDEKHSPTRSMPRLLPRPRWAKVALLLLMLFTLSRSVLWASVQPGWLAPDEDYHYLYINYLVERHSFPNLNGPFTSQELAASVQLINQGAFLAGPVTRYSGPPHAVLDKLRGLSRKPEPPPPRPVLEAPLYYIGGAIVDKIFWGHGSIARLTLLRYYSAMLGMLTIFFAWLLASQILEREWQQLAAAAVAALQIILAFSASIVSNDVSVAVTLTATLAWLAWMLRAPPRGRQGIGLGVLIAIALLTKTSQLALVVIVPVALLGMWRVYPDHKRELVGVLKWAVSIPVVCAGWWYVYMLIKTHSVLGEEGNVTSAATGGSGAHGPGLSGLPHAAWLWFSTVYRNYWFNYLFYDVKANGMLFWLPLVGIGIVSVGLVLYLIRSRGTTFSESGARRRAVLLILWTCVVLVVPPMSLDWWRFIRGGEFLVAQGRFLTPAYPGLAVIAVIAMGELTRYGRRAWPIATALLVACSFCLYWATWLRWALEGFYGFADGHWLRLLYRASYFKPTWVTETSLAIMFAFAIVSFVYGFGITVVGSGVRASLRRDHQTTT